MLSQTINLFEESLNIFLERESKNIASDVTERNLCGRFSIYLTEQLNQQYLSGYYADTEYNRKQNGEVKTILTGKLKIVRINCDLIVHSRGEKILNDNLLTIEMKKSSRPAHEMKSDRERLLTMTKLSYNDTWSNDGTTHPEHVCGYVLGVYIILDLRKKIVELEYYENGNAIDYKCRTLLV